MIKIQHNLRYILPALMLFCGGGFRAAARVYSATAVQQQTGYVQSGSTNNAILRINITTTAGGSTLTMSALTVAYTGTAASDIGAGGVKLWTGTATAPATQIGTAQSLSGNAATFSGLTQTLASANNYYWITLNVASGATVGNVIDAKININAITLSSGAVPAAAQNPAGSKTIYPYCVPGYNTGAATDGITQFTVNGTTDGSASASASPYFTYVSAPVLSATAGVAASYSFTQGYVSDRANIYMDLNNDGDFTDANETLVMNAGNGGSPNTAGGTFTIPAATPAGVYYLRVRNEDNTVGNTITPCGTLEYGETRDYKVTVAAAPSCLPPAVSAASNITAASATLNWTAATPAPAGGYDWEVRTSGAGGSGNTGLAASGSTGAGVLTAATGAVLNPSTVYEIYVRSNCGGGDLSAWAGPVAFMTACIAVNVPYTEGFEGAAVPAVPLCSVVQDVNADGTTWVSTATNPASGTKALFYAYDFTNAANDWWFTPGINLAAGNDYTVSFKYRVYYNFYEESLELKTGTSQNAAGMSSTLWSVTDDTNAVYQAVYTTFNAAATGVQYFGWHANSQADQDGLFVDDVSITQVTTAPGCVAAPVYPANNGTLCSGGTTLKWAAVAGATGYDVYFNSGVGASMLVSSNQSGLSYNAGVLAAGNYSWKLVPRNSIGLATGCADFGFTVNATPVVTLNVSDTTLCPGVAASLPLTASGATTYSWNPATGLSAATGASVTATPTKTTVYTVTGTAGGCSARAQARVTVSPAITATVTATPATLCIGGTSQLNVAPSGTAQQYTMKAIAPNVMNVATGTPVTAWAGGSTDDDYFAATIPFSFKFYGNSYTTLRISTNGYMTFNGAGQATEYIPQALPDATQPNNLIAAVWTDLEQTGTAVTKTMTAGTAPNRVFVVDYADVPLLAGTGTVSAQVQLYEGTNVVEIHISHATGIAASGFDEGSIGIESTTSGGIKGYSPGGRSLFTTDINTQEAYRFTPDSVTYAWAPYYTLNNAAIKNPVATPATFGPNVYTVGITNVGSGCVLYKNDTVNVRPNGQWTGTTSTDWNTATNWCGGVPTVSSGVIINAGPVNMPISTGSAFANTLSIGAGASLIIGTGGLLEIYGDMSNDGALDISNGAVTFAGSGAAQVVAGFTATNMSLTNTGGGISPTSDITVTGNLNLNSGIVHLNGSDLLMPVGATLSGGNSTSFVEVPNSNSRFRRYVDNAGTPVLMPIGTDTYNPVTLTNTGSAADVYSVYAFNDVLTGGTTGSSVSSPVIDRTWDISEGTAGGSNVQAEFQWQSSEGINAFDLSHVYMAHYTDTGAGPQWVNTCCPLAILAPAASSLGGGWFSTTLAGISSFSPFAVASSGANPLAVSLLSLSAANEGSRNKIEWRSATEDGLLRYEVERSADGKSFARMDAVNAKGQAWGYIVYDNSPAAGFTWYRLKMVDADGSISYSSIVQAYRKTSGGISIQAYPNPVAETLTVTVYGTQTGTATLSDAEGRVVRSGVVKDGSAQLSTGALSSGIYFLKVTDGQQAETMKVTKP